MRLNGLPAALALFLLLGCHGTRPAAAPVHEYGFRHLETTGVTSHILVPGIVRPPDRPERFDDVAILFSSDSDRDAVLSLHSLDTSVFLPNSDGHGLVVVGALDPEVRHTPRGPGRAESEPYQEFRLSRWYLRAPFVRESRIPLDEKPPAIQHDDRLRPEDFGGRVPGDLSRFVRPRD